MSVFNATGAERHRKWFALEVRFERALTRREIRRLEQLALEYGDTVGVHIGRDGLVTDQWPSKWPDQEDEESLREALEGLPAHRVRTAPYGATCTPESCPEHEACSANLGSADSCLPDLSQRDWISLE